MARKKHLTLDWYKKLGWRANPFKTKILSPVSYYLSGYDEIREKINYFIIEREVFGTITGEKGMGKTMLMQWVMEEMKHYRGRARALYVTGEELNKTIFLDKLINALLNIGETAGIKSMYGLKINKALNFVKDKLNLKNARWEESFYKNIYHKNYSDMMGVKMFLHSKLEKKSILFLIDDVDHMDAAVEETIKELLENKIPIQMIIAGSKEEIHEHSGRNFGCKDTLRVKLKKMKYAQAREIVKKRIKAVGGDDIFPFDDISLSKLWDNAESNPKKYLKLAQDYAVKQALKGVEKPTKIEKDVSFEVPSGFELPGSVAEAEERGELVIEDVKEDKHHEGEYTIRVKEHGASAIPMDLPDDEEDSAYKIREKKKKSRKH